MGDNDIPPGKRSIAKKMRDCEHQMLPPFLRLAMGECEACFPNGYGPNGIRRGGALKAGRAKKRAAKRKQPSPATPKKRKPARPSAKKKVIVLPRSSSAGSSSSSSSFAEPPESDDESDVEDIEDSSENVVVDVNPFDEIFGSKKSKPDNEESIGSWSEQISKRPKRDDDSSSSDEPLFKLPKCPICLGPLNMPVVDTDCCQNSICEGCVLECVVSGADYSEGPKCPCCRHRPFTYSESTVYNRLLGSREVACTNAQHGCNARVPISDMQTHIDKFCDFTPVTCEQEPFGCPWTGVRSQKVGHEERCVHVDQAKVRKAWEAEERRMHERLHALEDRCQVAEQRIDVAVTKFRGEIDKQLKELKHMQSTHIDNLTNGYMVMPKPGERALSVRRQDTRTLASTSMLLRMVVDVQDGECVISIASKDVRLRYPFWIAGYVVCLNKGMDARKATTQFHYRFGSSKDVTELTRIPKSALELGVGESGKMQIEPISLQVLISAYSN